MSNIINSVAYLRTSREFPDDLYRLARESNKSYIDVANAVNNRIIGLFPVNKAAQTGENWYLQANQKQQSLRQVYMFTATTPINHNVQVNNAAQFTNCYGSYTDGTDSYGLIFASSTAIAGQISFYLTSTQIMFATGAGAPSLTSGIIVLQWLSAV